MEVIVLEEKRGWLYVADVGQKVLIKVRCGRHGNLGSRTVMYSDKLNLFTCTALETTLTGQ